MDDQEKEVTEAETEKPVEQKHTFINVSGYEHKSQAKGEKATWIFLAVLIIILAVFGFLFKHQIKTLISGNSQPAPSPSPAATAEPAPTPNSLIRSEWSLEVLNGTQTAGLAKKIAGRIEEQGYQVVKTGNADKNTYSQTEILVKKDKMDKVDLIIADLKDAVKIASVSGELTEGTASARIIIGKDSL